MHGLSQSQVDAATAWFQDNFIRRGELGASVSIWLDGTEVLALSDGWMSRERQRAWTHDTLAPVWSATKGPAALSTLLALHDAGLPLSAPVCEVWPEFFLDGKDRITFAHVLSHTAGLSALSEPAPIFDYQAVIRALERQPPLAPPGELQAYHARTFGFLLEEIVRRITGADSLGHWFDWILGRPLALDFWIGLPQEHHHRVATLYPGKVSLAAHDQAFLKAFSTAATLTQRSFASPSGLGAVHDFNRPETWSAGYASMGGVGSARGLGKLYSVLANGGKHQGAQVLPTWVLQALQTPLSQAEDAVLCTPLAFSAGMMMDPIDAGSNNKVRELFGSGSGAFGHPGAGGSHAFADPDSGIAVAYVMNQMETSVLPNEKVLGIIRALSSSQR
jgi:CubicO group peptidase (beta-lactamase class C family)